MDFSADVIITIFRQSGWRAATSLGLSDRTLYGLYMSCRGELLQQCVRACMQITKMPMRDRGVGIAGHVHVTDELADFLNMDRQAKLPRTEVIAHIACYIQANNLENPNNRRYINPDARLSSLLVDYNPGDTLSYFNLHRYLKNNFMNTKPILTNDVLSFSALPTRAMDTIIGNIGLHNSLTLAQTERACRRHVSRLYQSLMMDLIMKYATFAREYVGKYGEKFESEDLYNFLKSLRKMGKDERPIWCSAMQEELEGLDWLTEYLDGNSE